MADNQWISFEVGSETYVHPVGVINEIIPYAAPVPVPGSHADIEGILNVRGNVVTVLSGCTLFDEQESDNQEEKRIIIFVLGADQVGVSVDAVRNIIDFNPENADWSEQSTQHPLIKGTVQLNDKLYILTDFTNYVLGNL